MSLFSAVTGGNDWMFYGDYLRRSMFNHFRKALGLRKLKLHEHDVTGEIYFCIFAFYAPQNALKMLKGL